MSASSRTCCVKPLRHTAFTPHHYHLLLLERVWVGDGEMKSGSEADTTTEHGVHWPETKLSDESAYSSLFSEAHLERWSVAGQWGIDSFVLTTLSTQAVAHVSWLCFMFIMHTASFLAIDITMDSLYKTNFNYSSFVFFMKLYIKCCINRENNEKLQFLLLNFMQKNYKILL